MAYCIVIRMRNATLMPTSKEKRSEPEVEGLEEVMQQVGERAQQTRLIEEEIGGVGNRVEQSARVADVADANESREQTELLILGFAFRHLQSDGAARTRSRSRSNAEKHTGSSCEHELSATHTVHARNLSAASFSPMPAVALVVFA